MSQENKNQEKSGETFSEVMLGQEFFQSNWGQKLKTLSPGWFAGIFAFLVFVPYLGAVGLWDPWETHYGEVAREMIQRRDYVHPFWENAWFFSKPAFTMWMQAFGMQLVGALRSPGELGTFTEWGFRLPFAAFSITAVVLMALALSRTVSRRAGLAWAFVICTMPIYFLISRQAVTDTPMISALISAMACAMVGQFDSQTQHRTAWWYGFYIFAAIGTLAKGLLGVGIPAVIFILYVLAEVVPLTFQEWRTHFQWLSSDAFRRRVAEGELPMPALWAQMFSMRLLTGSLLFIAVAIPWYLKMFLFRGVDDEGKLFWYRFLIHDHFSRLGAGVHTTTPGGTFTYFIEQGGYGIFPWVLLIPGMVAVVAGLRFRSKKPVDGVILVALIWAAFTFYLIGSSATKFHHYVLPMVPPVAMLMAIFIDRLWIDGLAKHAGLLLLGVPLLGLVGKDLVTNTKNFTDLFVYNYDRPYPTQLVTQPVLGSFSVQGLLALFFVAAGVLLAVALLSRSKSLFFGIAWAAVVAFALWLNWSHWVQLSHHWTQRDLFWRYYRQRQESEPIAAYFMNWRGETFYSRNQVKQIKENSLLTQYANLPGRKWALVEQSRLGILKSAVGPDKTLKTIDKDLNNKFVLVTIEP